MTYRSSSYIMLYLVRLPSPGLGSPRKRGGYIPDGQFKSCFSVGLHLQVQQRSESEKYSGAAALPRQSSFCIEGFWSFGSDGGASRGCMFCLVSLSMSATRGTRRRALLSSSSVPVVVSDGTEPRSGTALCVACCFSSIEILWTSVGSAAELGIAIALVS